MAENYSYWNNGNSDNSGNDNFFNGWDNAKTPVPIPPGTYIAVLISWTPIRNSNGTPNLKFSYRIERGEYAGQFVTDLKAMTKAAMGWTKRFCNSLEIDPRRSVSDYPKIWVELVATVKEGAGDRQYVEVLSVRRINPPDNSPEGQTPAQTSPPVPGSSSQTQAEEIPQVEF